MVVSADSEEEKKGVSMTDDENEEEEADDNDQVEEMSATVQANSPKLEHVTKTRPCAVMPSAGSAAHHRPVVQRLAFTALTADRSSLWPQQCWE